MNNNNDQSVPRPVVEDLSDADIDFMLQRIAEAEVDFLLQKEVVPLAETTRFGGQLATVATLMDEWLRMENDAWHLLNVKKSKRLRLYEMDTNILRGIIRDLEGRIQAFSGLLAQFDIEQFGFTIQTDGRGVPYVSSELESDTETEIMSD